MCVFLGARVPSVCASLPPRKRASLIVWQSSSKVLLVSRIDREKHAGRVRSSGNFEAESKRGHLSNSTNTGLAGGAKTLPTNYARELPRGPGSVGGEAEGAVAAPLRNGANVLSRPR